MSVLNISLIHKLARQGEARIGIGGGMDVVNESARAAESGGFAAVEVFKSPTELVSALSKGDIQAAVRGALGAKDVLSLVKSEFGVESLMRIALMKMDNGKIFLLAPVGVDEGRGIEERLEFIIQSCTLLARFKIAPRVAVLSGGRLEDLGRHITVDETLMEGEKLTSMALDNGIPARHFGILIEQALATSNVIIPPNGIHGNLIFRTLHFLGGAKGIGAPVVNCEKVFVDTSRSKEDYTDTIALASALCGL